MITKQQKTMLLFIYGLLKAYGNKCRDILVFFE
jgi:hypothetical protein